MPEPSPSAMNMNTKAKTESGMRIPAVSAIIVAAGGGTRMGGISKPEIKLNGKTLLERVLETFLASSVYDITVVCGANRERLQMIAQTVPTAGKPVRFCDGGKTRSQSVFAGACSIEAKDRLLCVHDCARPFVTAELIDTVIEAAKTSGAATACSPVTDTIKFVDEEHHAIYTPKRKHLLAIQTPQVFRHDQYEVAYALALRQSRADAYTDETSMLEAAGVSVTYVHTDARNIKLTTREDITLARAILSIQKSEESQI